MSRPDLYPRMRNDRVSNQPAIIVEFFGIPRQRAGRAELTVAAGTVAELLAAIEAACPTLNDLRRPDGRLSGHYLLSVNGDRFLTDGKDRLRAGDKVLVISADAGG
jgi:molybdopterin converting factor small subunit